MDLQRWIDQYTNYLLKMSFLYVKDRQVAEDIVQDVFLKLLEKPEAYDERGNEKSFLVRLTINRSKDYLKSWHYRKMQWKDVLGLETGYSPKDALITAEENTEVGQAVMNLPLKYREMIILYYFEEQTVYEMAETLEIPVSTAKTRLVKARQLVKAQLKDNQWEVLNDEA